MAQEPLAQPGVRQRLLLVAAAALAATVLVAVVPGLRFTYVSATTRVAMEAAQTVIAGIVAVLVHGRVRRTGAGCDQLLAVALGFALCGNLLTVVLRASAEDRDALSRFGGWSALSLTLLSATAYVLASSVGDRRLSPRMRSATVPAGVVAAGTGAVLAAAWALARDLPLTVTGDFSTPDASRPSLDASEAAMAVHGLTLVLLVAASIGFARRAERQGDALVGAVAVGLVLAATARLNFVLYPSIHTTVVHTGDVARLGCYVVLLGGAMREISSYWRDRAQLAVLEERGRIARELHDGLVQELSFIRSQVSSFERLEPSRETIGFVTEAADRALAESRRAVSALSDDSTGTLDRRIRRTVSDVADRAGLAARFDLPPGIDLDPAVADQVERIVREATTNVVRHAGASTVTVSLRRRTGELRVVVSDDGCGIPAKAAGAGFGLRSMRDRASSVGGSVVVEPAADGGTQVVLTVPVRAGRRREPQVLDQEVDERDGVA